MVKRKVRDGVPKSKPRYRVGEWMSFPFGSSVIRAYICEVRGPFGGGGEMLYGLRPTKDWAFDYIEIQESGLTPTEPPPEHLRRDGADYLNQYPFAPVTPY